MADLDGVLLMPWKGKRWMLTVRFMGPTLLITPLDTYPPRPRCLTLGDGKEEWNAAKAELGGIADDEKLIMSTTDDRVLCLAGKK